MLKRTLLATCIGILLISQNVQAGDTAQNGAWGGAAGGAILGQAIGRNTRGTLLGTAIGGVLGYMVGNEMEKDPGQTMRVYSPPPRVVQQYENDYEERVVIIDRDRDDPPHWGHRWGHGRDNWRSGHYDRDRD